MMRAGIRARGYEWVLMRVDPLKWRPGEQRRAAVLRSRSNHRPQTAGTLGEFLVKLGGVARAIASDGPLSGKSIARWQCPSCGARYLRRPTDGAGRVRCPECGWFNLCRKGSPSPDPDGAE